MLYIGTWMPYQYLTSLYVMPQPHLLLQFTWGPSFKNISLSNAGSIPSANAPARWSKEAQGPVAEVIFDI